MARASIHLQHMNPSDKFEANIRQAEEILDHARADLMNFLPGIESSKPAVAEGSVAESVKAPVIAISEPQEEKETPATSKKRGGWLHSLLHKP